MRGRALIVRKLSILILMSVAIIPFVLRLFFSADYLGYWAAIGLSLALLTIIGIPISILSEYISYKIKSMIRDYNYLVQHFGFICAYIGVSCFFSVLLIILFLVINPLVVFALGIIYSVLLVAFIFTLLDLILIYTYKYVYNKKG